MKKRILCYVISAIMVICFAVMMISPVSATEIEASETAVTVAETEVVTSSLTTEVIDAIENTESRGEAILSLAQKLGITVEEAESIINTVIEVGDEYVGEKDWWESFKISVQEDMQFWTLVVVIAAALLTMFGGVFVLLSKTNPMMKKAMWGMAESLKVSDQIKQENSQTLGELKKIFEEAAKKEAAFERIIEEKEEYLTDLEAKIHALEEASQAEHTNMIEAEMYSLRILKLILDRTAMPLSDKSTIDLFYNKGVEALRKELSEEDIARIEETIATLDNVNSGGDLQ